MLRSYPQIYALGHRAITELLLDPVVVQEKVDGSQFSFGLIDGVLHMRSKGAVVDPRSPDKLFAAAVNTVCNLQERGLLHEGWTYRAEVLAKPKHNTLSYARVPVGNLVLFDIVVGDEEYLSPLLVSEVAIQLGLEVVPTFFEGRVSDLVQLEAFLERESFLGGVKIEGIAIKNYSRFGVDKKALMGKWVSEAFKEIHGADWQERNPNRTATIEKLVSELNTTARWEKAIQHIRDGGGLTETPADIGPLIREVVADIAKEEMERIKDVLFDYFWKDISRGVVRGLPEWYKEKLARSQPVTV